jgi:hypothetical protein
MDDPLDPGALSQTLKDLNRTIEGSILHFQRGEGRGQVEWVINL